MTGTNSIWGGGIHFLKILPLCMKIKHSMVFEIVTCGSKLHPLRHRDKHQILPIYTVSQSVIIAMLWHTFIKSGSPGCTSILFYFKFKIFCNEYDIAKGKNEHWDNPTKFCLKESCILFKLNLFCTQWKGFLSHCNVSFNNEFFFLGVYKNNLEYGQGLF